MAEIKLTRLTSPSKKRKRQTYFCVSNCVPKEHPGFPFSLNLSVSSFPKPPPVHDATKLAQLFPEEII